MVNKFTCLVAFHYLALSSSSFAGCCVFTTFSNVLSNEMRKPHFFKILLGDFEKRLRIPPYFVKKFFKESSSDELIIHDANGDAWNVGLDRINSGTFLTRGWGKFVKDHKLKQHEFVVFRYEGNMRFSVVLVFDTTACEKDCMLMAEHSPEQPSSREESSEANQLSDIFRHCKKRNNGTNRQQMIQKNQGLYSDAMYEIKTEKEGSEGSGRKGKQKMEHSLNVYFVPQNKRIKTESHSFSKEPLSSSRGRGNSEAEEKAKLFRSKFPFFVTIILPSDMIFHHSKALPASFARVHLPPDRMKITLHDPNEKDWVVMYIPSRGKFKFVGGWRAFMRGNNIQQGDYCAFELVDHREFRVTIFRGEQNDYKEFIAFECRSQKK